VLGLRESLPPTAQRWIALGCDAIIGLFGVGMAIWSWELVEMVMNFRIPLLGISQGWTYVPMVVGGVLIALFAVEQVLRDIFVPEAPEKRGPAAAFLE
jgi:TRAP-type C4-dicarboxylate transport system permease small subunit